MKELTEKFRKDKDMFMVEIEGKDIKNLQEYFSCISELCMFPTISRSWSSYEDWMRDFCWIEQKKITIIIYNFKYFMQSDIQARNEIIEDFEELIFPWWESEVLQFEVGGETKEFMVYLVD